MEIRYVVFIVGVLLVQSCLAFAPSNLTDLSSLLAFKSEIKFDPHNVLGSNWNETVNFCNWVGVSCSPRRQRVTALSLGHMGLQGTISPHLGNLSFLVQLDLRNNSFHGRLTPEIGRLRRLRGLILQDNLLEGVIPASIGHCQMLEVISLSYNEFTGVLPKFLSDLPSLLILFLRGNHFTGTIPPSLANNSKLEWLTLGQNYLQGSIPAEIGNLQNLQRILWGRNNLTGSIPPSIFNISSLQRVSFVLNGLSGSLPSSFCLHLPNLQRLFLGGNFLSGTIPVYLSNCSQLTRLDLGGNQFTGQIPTSLGLLEHLVILSLGSNQLTSQSANLELSFLTALTTCRSLEVLIINENRLNGLLPDSFGNLSNSLQLFRADSCQIKGPIPKEIGSFINLTLLNLGNNSLRGTIPSTITGMKSLQRLYLYDNQLEQSIPEGICILSNLGVMHLDNNKLFGSVPSCIGNLTRLQQMDLSSNSVSSIPSSLWSLQNLLFLNLSCNSLGGSLDPDMRALKMLVDIDLSHNRISGKIPTILGAFQSLSSLNLSANSFWGPIPEKLGELITLDFMDLSHNSLSGEIPKSLVALSHLRYLNLSFNNLSGEIPSEGPFVNFTAASFLQNEALCGQPIFQVPPCTAHSTRKSKTKILLKFVLPLTALVSILVALFFVMIKYRKKNVGTLNSVDSMPALEHRLISYQELRYATNDFSEDNILGVGSFCSVFKGILSDGLTVAVKVLNLQIEGAFKSFDTECKVLTRVRHRNLVKVISSCSNPELRALVLQYVPNGSLEKWLNSHNFCLNLFQRVSIMVDVAVALEYLHHGQSEPVVHCDLKPSNVLLDDDMVAHVADFGIAKILAHNKTLTQTKTLGTVGYIAPEYGSQGIVSTRGDVYSYGIMLLEMFTRKKPTDEMFAEEVSLRQWVEASVPEKIMEVVDGGLLSIEDGESGRDVMATQGNILVGVIELGLECSRESPEERKNIREVVVQLNKIKLELLSRTND